MEVIKAGMLEHAQQKFDKSSNLRFAHHFVWLDGEGLHWGRQEGNYQSEENYLRKSEIERVESYGPVGTYDYSFKVVPFSKAEERHIFACSTYDDVYMWMGNICATCEIDFNPDEK